MSNLPFWVLLAQLGILNVFCGSLDLVDKTGSLDLRRKSSRTRRSTVKPDPFTEEEKEAGLALHNKYRSEQGASNMAYLEWHPELARMAQEYTEGCLYEHSDQTNDGCYNITFDSVGENLHMNTAKVPLVSAVKAWYIEINYFNYDDVTCQKGQKCGHYTQVVWAKTKLVGCGRSFCPVLRENNGETTKNAYFTSCNYGMRGNYAGAKPFKKGDACSECDKGLSCTDNLCYQTGVDYQRPAEKLKADCVTSGNHTPDGFGTGATTVKPDPFTEEEKEAGLALHNKYRSEEGASNMAYLEWHPELAQMAQEYTEGCLYEHSDQTNDGCYNITFDSVGENLHMNTAKVPLVSAVKAWYVEINYFNYDDVTCQEGEKCGHYTQVVWAKTKLVGCGRSFCPVLRENNGETTKNAYFTSCNYGMRGNYAGAKPFKKGDACSECDQGLSCTDNLCYQTGVDYQRPAKKLKTDCVTSGNQTPDGGGTETTTGKPDPFTEEEKELDQTGVDYQRLAEKLATDCVTFGNQTPDGGGTGTTTGKPDPFTEEEKEAGLALHNKYRSEQGASNMAYLEWHPELARMAQEYTEGCLYEHSDQTNDGCYNITFDSVGENLHMNTAKVPLVAAVKAWCVEINYFNYDDVTCQEGKKCGHYTQVVWAKTKLVGCGRSFCPVLRENNGETTKNAYFTSCNYGMRGNYAGAKPFKKGDACSECDQVLSCTDNLCYKTEVDYQRPAKKLKTDCVTSGNPTPDVTSGNHTADGGGTGTTTGKPDPFTEEEKEAGLALHNKYRSEQGASNMAYLEWHPELARMAQEYTEGCLYEHSDQTNDGCYNITFDSVGENLHMNTAKVPLVSAVKAWYVEINYFNYDDVTCQEGEKCGHYTQVVWAKTKLVGCGRSFCPVLRENNGETTKNAYFTSCNYGMRGNYEGAKPFKKGDACSECDQGLSCTDNLCYQTGVDYQRPAEKLKTDCVTSGNQTPDGGGTGTTIKLQLPLIGMIIIPLLWVM